MNTKVIFCSKNETTKKNYNKCDKKPSNLIFVETKVEDFLKYNSQMSVVTLFVPSNDYTIYPDTPTNKAILERFPNINKNLVNLIEKITSKKKKHIITQGTSFIFRSDPTSNIFFTVSVLPNVLSTDNIHTLLNGIFFLIEKYNINNNIQINTILMQEIPYLNSVDYFDSIVKIFNVNNQETPADKIPDIFDIYLINIESDKPPKLVLPKKRKR